MWVITSQDWRRKTRLPETAEPNRIIAVGQLFRIIPNIDTFISPCILPQSMDATANHSSAPRLSERLAARGFRFTPQRDHVYAVLLRKRDHPTAEEVFIRAKREMPDISMATVYNCLDALVQCGLARQLTLERGAARFCPNMSEHCHFYCDSCESVFDIDLPPEARLPLPKGFKAERCEVTIHGRCPACGQAAAHAPTP
jgi:Fur family peroxide stress response transcriptional regulator